MASTPTILTTQKLNRALLSRQMLLRREAITPVLHLLSAKDYVKFRGSIQPALSASMQSVLKSRASTVEVDAVVAEAERCFAERPQTFAELRAALSREFPDWMNGHGVCGANAFALDRALSPSIR